MVKIRTAGGLVTQNDKLLFIFKRNKWDLPKGKIKQGHSKRQTALIEIEEETGLKSENMKIIQKLIPTYYYKMISDELMLKKTNWYYIKYQGNPKQKLLPDMKEGITECKWFAKSDLSPVLNNTYPRIEYLLDIFLNSEIN